MSLTLPDLAVVDRDEPYAFAYVEVPIFEEEVPLVRDTAQADVQEVRALRISAEKGADAARLPDRIVRFEINARFATAPGDPSPFVRRDVGAMDCGALSGTAAIFCAVMSRR